MIIEYLVGKIGNPFRDCELQWLFINKKHCRCCRVNQFGGSFAIFFRQLFQKLDVSQGQGHLGALRIGAYPKAFYRGAVNLVCVKINHHGLPVRRRAPSDNPPLIAKHDEGIFAAAGRFLLIEFRLKDEIFFPAGNSLRQFKFRICPEVGTRFEFYFELQRVFRGIPGNRHRT